MSNRKLLTIAALSAALATPNAMATDWLKTKQHWLYPTTDKAVPSPEPVGSKPMADSNEAWRAARQPERVVTDGAVVATSDGASTPKLDAIEAWKQAKFPHLQTTRKR